MLQKCFQNIFIVGNIICICILPLLIYLSRFKSNYNIKHIYKIFLIISIILLLPIFKFNIKSVKLKENPIIKDEVEYNHNNFGEIFIIENDTASCELSNSNITTSNSIIDKNIDIQIKSDTLSKIYSYLPYIWISVFVGMFIYYIIMYKIYIHSLNIKFIKNSEIEKLINNIKSQMNLKINIKYAFSSNVITPISIGILKKKIIIPIDGYDLNDFEYILKHEIFHIKNKDIEFKFLLLILNSLYWFNPIIYFLSNQIDEVLELNCDYNILKSETTEYRIKYGNILLNQIEKSKKNQCKFVMNFASSRRSIMERFSNIINETKKKKGVVISIILIAFIIISISIIIFTPNVNIAATEPIVKQGNTSDIAVIKEENTDVSNVVENPETTESMKIEFIKPIEGNITSKFGVVSSIRGNIVHQGIDIASSIGTPIKASLSGTVIYAGFDESSGNYIVVEHENMIKTYYEHCKTLYVKAGDIVNQGDVIAESGATGKVTGPHLHFEIRINDEAVDPSTYINFDN